MRHFTRTCGVLTIVATAALFAAGRVAPSQASALTHAMSRNTALLNVSNFGRMSTQVFHADGDWTIQYSMSCKSGTTNFSITTYQSDGTYGDLLENLITKRLSKTQYEHNSGDWYLVIDGDCPWRVKVTGSGRSASTRSPKGRTLLSVSGTGTMSTRTFTAKGNWAISYSMSCRGDTANFSIVSYKDNQYNALLENLIVGRISKTQFLHVGGKYYLKIDGSCPWRVTVKG